MAKIDYSYQEGLRIGDQEKAPAEIRQPLFPDAESYQQFAESLVTATDRKNARIGTFERNIGYTLLNAKSNGELVIFHPYWGAHFEGEVGKREAAAIQRGIGDRALLLIDNPGSGRSDNLTPLAKEAAKTGSFLPYGEFYAEAFEGVTAGFDSVAYAGASMGGRMAIAESAHSAKPNQVVAIDPPGSRKMTTFGLMRRFMITEAGHSRNYQKGALEYDPKSAEAQIAQDKPIEFVHKLGDAAHCRALLDLIWREPRAMARRGLEHDLEQALANENTVKATILTPDRSALTDTTNLPDMEGVALSTIEDHTHALFAGHPGKFEHIMRFALNEHL